MLKLFILVALAISGSQGGSQKHLPLNNEHRIVNGVNVKPGEFPSQLSLQEYGYHICGASIISAFWALTAAHCVTARVFTSRITLLAGTVNLASGGTLHEAQRIIVHEDYDSKDSWKNDIALIQVKTPFNIDFVNVSIADLPKQGETTPDGEVVTVIGWGRSYQGGPLSDDLQKVDILTVNQEKCESIYAGVGYNIYTGHICADVPEGNKGSCNGDSGGPLFRNGQVIGLVSWAYGCATQGYPTVYTRVAEYRKWINQKTGI